MVVVLLCGGAGGGGRAGRVRGEWQVGAALVVVAEEEEEEMRGDVMLVSWLDSDWSTAAAAEGAELAESRDSRSECLRREDEDLVAEWLLGEGLLGEWLLGDGDLSRAESWSPRP